MQISPLFLAEEVWSLEDTLATLTARFHKKVVLDMYVWTDDRDSQRHIIYVRKQRVRAQLVHNSYCIVTTDKPEFVQLLTDSVVIMPLRTVQLDSGLSGICVLLPQIPLSIMKTHVSQSNSVMVTEAPVAPQRCSTL